jgi:hypothetical protein
MMRKIIAAAGALTLAAGCAYGPGSGGSTGGSGGSNASARPQITAQPPPLPPMGSGALPVPMADANVPGTKFACHDVVDPGTHGISVVNLFGLEVEGLVRVHCDTPALVPVFQTIEVALFLETPTGPQMEAFNRDTRLPGVGAAQATAYVAAAKCVPGTWYLSYAIVGVDDLDRPFIHGPINSEREITSCS